MVPRRLEFPAERSSGSRLARVRYHGVRWLLLVFVAVVTYAMFPAPASGPGSPLFTPCAFSALASLHTSW